MRSKLCIDGLCLMGNFQNSRYLMISLGNETTEEQSSCDSSYPSTCIPSPPPNLSCDNVGASNFDAWSPGPHGFDGDNDGIGCENRNTQRPES